VRNVTKIAAKFNSCAVNYVSKVYSCTVKCSLIASLETLLYSSMFCSIWFGNPCGVRTTI